MIKELRVLHLLPSSRAGGAQTNLLNILPYLKSEKCKNYVGVGGYGALTEEFKDAGSEVLTLSKYPLNYKNPYSWVAIVRLIKIIKKEKICIIHAHLDVPIFMAFITKILTKTSIIIHIHDFGMFSKREFPFYKPNLVSLSLSKIIYPFSSKILVITKKTREVLRRRKKLKGKIELIYNGILIKKRPNRVEKNGKYRFISIGRITKQKNHQILVQASKLIPKRYKYKIYIVGDGPYLENLKQLIRQQNLNDRFSFLGFRRDIDSLLNRSDCFLLPSLWELFPITILEAMSIGIPVIASDVGDIRELVEDRKSGYIIPPNDLIALSSRMVDVMDNQSNSIKMGLNGYNIIKQKFDIESISKRIVEIYKEVLIN